MTASTLTTDQTKKIRQIELYKKVKPLQAKLKATLGTNGKQIDDHLKNICELVLSTPEQLTLFLLKYQKSLPKQPTHFFDRWFQPKQKEDDLEELLVESSRLVQNENRISDHIEAYSHSLAIAEDVKESALLSNGFENFNVSDLPNLYFHDKTLLKLERRLASEKVMKDLRGYEDLISQYQVIDQRIDEIENKIYKHRLKRIKFDIYDFCRKEISQSEADLNLNVKLLSTAKENVEAMVKRELLRSFASSLLFLEKEYICELCIRAKNIKQYPQDVKDKLRAYYNEEKVSDSKYEPVLSSDTLFKNSILQNELENLLIDTRGNEVASDITIETITKLIKDHLANNMDNIKKLRRDAYYDALFNFKEWEGKEKTEDEPAIPSCLMQHAEKNILKPLRKLPALVDAVMRGDNIVAHAEDVGLVKLIEYTKSQVESMEPFINLDQKVKPTHELR